MYTHADLFLACPSVGIYFVNTSKSCCFCITFCAGIDTPPSLRVGAPRLMSLLPSPAMYT